MTRIFKKMKKNKKVILNFLPLLPINSRRELNVVFIMNSKIMLNISHTFLLTILLTVTNMSYAIDAPLISEKSKVSVVINNDRHKLQGLRLGFYQTRGEIEEIVIKLHKLGFETKVKQLKQGYIVSAGAFSSTLNFERALNRLKKAGLGDKVHVVKVSRRRTKGIASVQPKKKRSTVFTSQVLGTQDKNIMDEYVPKKNYVKLEQEVGTLKAQMQLLLEKLALTEQDLNTKQLPKAQEQKNTKEKKPDYQKLAKASQAKENKPDIVKPKKSNEGIEDDKELTREDEAKEAKRGLDTFLRGKKVLYKPGELELEFDLAYGQDTAVNTFGFSPTTNASRSNAKLTTRSVDSSLTLRYGIVDDLEFTLAVPYGYFEQNGDNQPFNKEVKPVCTEELESIKVPECTMPGSPRESIVTAPVSHTNAVGVGDVGGSLSYNLFSESGNIPSITLSLSGQAPTGNYNRGLGSGFWGIGGSVSLVKTIDPVVFFGSLGYSAAFEERGTDPSDQVSYSMGAGYSMNDRVSFSTSLSGRLTGRTKVNGIDRPGTSMDAHSLQFNTTIQLTKRLFIEPFIDFGLTKDASDFAVGLRFPYRFGEKFPLPFLSD